MTTTQTNGRDVMETVRSRMDDRSLPPPVRASVRGHCENLVRLADSLRQMGMAEEQIDAHVIGIFEEYECELAANLERIRAAENTGQADGR